MQQQFIKKFKKILKYTCIVFYLLCTHLQPPDLWNTVVGEYGHKKSQLNKLQKVQNKCVSLIMNKSILTKDYTPLKLLTIEDTIWLYNVKLGHRLRHSHLPITIGNPCHTDSKNRTLKKTHDYDTRYKKNEIHPMASSKDYKTSYLVKVMKAYNDIPES